MEPGFRLFLSWSFWIVEWIAVGLLASAGYALDVTVPDAGKDPIFLQPLVQFVQAHATVLGILLGAYIVVNRAVRRLRKDGESKELRVMHRMVNRNLDKFRQVVFPGLSDTIPQDENRVTMFKYQPFKWTLRLWPWSGWLVMLERSGHLTRYRAPIFRVTDNPEKCEGIAGRAWRSGAVRSGNPKAPLPDLSDMPYTNWYRAFALQIREWFNDDSPSVVQYAEHRRMVDNYAQATCTSSRVVWTRLRQGKPCPTSILGILIYGKGKRPWGVLAMDSCNSIACIDSNDRKFVRALNQLMDTLDELEWL